VLSYSSSETFVPQHVISNAMATGTRNIVFRRLLSVAALGPSLGESRNSFVYIQLQSICEWLSMTMQRICVIYKFVALHNHLYFGIVCAVMGLCTSTILNNVLKNDAFIATSHEIHSTGGRNIPALPVNTYHKQRQCG
jgi:hypothetical protein